MIQINDNRVLKSLFKGNFGLEKEALRVTEEGEIATSLHPFDATNSNIVRDFCESQTEINTGIHRSAREVVEELREHHRRIVRKVASMQPVELLWPFSNPPYLTSDSNIPIALFQGDLAEKTHYREYLSRKYGRHKMTFSGIHFNYSFSGDLLRAAYEAETSIRIEKGKETADYRRYVDRLYIDVLQGLIKFGWIVVALMSASPLLDCSYFRSDVRGKDLCLGMASVRCSELGYWNLFVPVFDYTDISSYTNSIANYVKKNWIVAPSELYYPVRLKPRGENTLEGLIKNGASHIEIRCIDLNPFAEGGIDERDIEFLQLLIIWLASTRHKQLSSAAQVMAIQNFKNAARFDLGKSYISFREEGTIPATEAIVRVLYEMEQFFKSIPEIEDVGRQERVAAILRYQRAKMEDVENCNYAHIVRRTFSDTFVEKGLEWAKRETDAIIKEISDNV
ncbi:MAG: hypothetical protein K2K64_11795 [Muribaculaceae bacterium]|nr:hypothetical protein [Muribaculaceae bacterium]